MTYGPHRQYLIAPRFFHFSGSKMRFDSREIVYNLLFHSVQIAHQMLRS